MIRFVYGVLVAICGAVLVHIAIIFLIPRLNQPAILNQMQTLDQTRDPLVFSGREDIAALTGLDPFFRYRICFYDLEDGPFQLISTGDVPFFSASLMANNGDVLFSITDRQTINRTLNIEVRSASQQQRLVQTQADNTAIEGAVPVYVSAPKGYAIIRAFIPDPSWNEIVSDFLSDIACQQDEAVD
jgi:uncharacterized membrane protein